MLGENLSFLMSQDPDFIKKAPSGSADNCANPQTVRLCDKIIVKARIHHAIPSLWLGSHDMKRPKEAYKQYALKLSWCRLPVPERLTL